MEEMGRQGMDFKSCAEIAQQPDGGGPDGGPVAADFGRYQAEASLPLLRLSVRHAILNLSLVSLASFAYVRQDCRMLSSWLDYAGMLSHKLVMVRALDGCSV